MANDIDPITGLPPLTFQRPQTEKFTKSLEEKLGQGAAQYSAPQAMSLEQLRAEMYKLQQKERTVPLDERIKNLEAQISNVSSYDPRIQEAQTRYAEAKKQYDFYRNHNVWQMRGQADKYKVQMQNIEGEISQLSSARREASMYRVDSEEGKQKFLASPEGRIVGGAIEGLERENLLLEDIDRFRLSAERGMAQELQRRLEGIQEEEGMARGIIGESGAKRGLLRSTFTQSGIEQSALREQERIGTERVGVQGQIRTLREAEKKLVAEIENQREKLLTIRNINEVAELERKRNMLVEAELRTNFMKAMAQAQIDAIQKESMMGTLAGLATTAAMTYAMSGCWVARAIFGIDNIKWLFARTYVIQESPKWFYNMYMKHGEKFSEKVKKSKILKAVLRPMFEYFSYKGEKLWQQ